MIIFVCDHQRAIGRNGDTGREIESGFSTLPVPEFALAQP
jgi:hypothetical protein